jgi:RNA polymerase sigma-70 factor (ECF subfamily)
MQRTININEELIEGCRKNNRRSQLQLYNQYYKAMYNSAYRILRNTAEAEDVMQESFLVAFRKIDEYKGEATFGAWLKRIVINRSIDELKKRKETVSLDESGMDVPADDNSENYLEMLSYKIDQIRKGIEMLADEDRIILSLLLLEGYDHEEISQVLDISNNASRTRYSRARRRLKELLRKEKMNELVN